MTPGHGDFLHGRIAGPFADPGYCGAGPDCTRINPAQRVGNSQPEIIMTVYLQLHICRNRTEQRMNPFGHLPRMMGGYRIRITEPADAFFI
ncbi:hypothetical protein D3C80_1554130 [compost metagenome]